MNKASKLLTSSLLGKEQSQRFLAGTPFQLCKTAHNYYNGRNGCQIDLEKAAEYFAQAASLGDAGGLYNLGKMTQEGKGVERNVLKGHQYIVEAANKPPVIEYIPGSGIKSNNIGVMESWHQLGMAYHFGIAVDKDYNEVCYYRSQLFDW